MFAIKLDDDNENLFGYTDKWSFTTSQSAPRRHIEYIFPKYARVSIQEFNRHLYRMLIRGCRTKIFIASQMIYIY